MIEEAAPRAPASRKRTVAVLAVVLVALCGAAALFAWQLFLRPTPRLARFAPRDAEVYVEIVDVRRFALEFVASGAVDTGELDAEEQLDRLGDALAGGLGLSDAEGARIIQSVESVALVARGLEPIGERFERRPEAALLVRLRDAAALKDLESSPRLEEEATFFGARELRLEPSKTAPDGKAVDWGDHLEDVLSGVSNADDPKIPKKERRAPALALLVVDAERLIVVGTRALALDVARVAAGDKSSLGDSPRFADASWDRRAVVVGYADPTVSMMVREDFFRDVPAWTAALRMSPEGVVTTARTSARGHAVHEAAFVPRPSKLDVVSRLPEGTIAYAALSLDRRGSSVEAARDLTATVDALDPRAGLELHRALLFWERELGGTLPAFFDAAGDAVAIAIVADEVPRPSVLRDEATFFEHAALLGVLELADPDEAERLLTDLRGLLEQRLASSHAAEAIAGGIALRPRSTGSTGSKTPSQPAVRIVTVEGKHVVVAIGEDERTAELVDDFGRAPLLEADPAHAASRGALPGELTALVWIDAGALLDAELSADRDLRRGLSDLGVPARAFRLEGDGRATVALGVIAEASGDEVVVESTSLNAPLFLALVALLEGPGVARGAEPKTEPTPTKPGETTGIRECDEYLAAIVTCAKNAPAAVRDALLQSGTTFRDSIKSMPDPVLLRGVCSQAHEALKSSGSCD